MVVFYLFMIIGVVACDIYLQVTRRSDFGWCHLTRIPEVRLSYRKHPRPTGSEESVSRILSYHMLVRLLEGCLFTDVCIPLLFHWSYRVTPGAACPLPSSPEGGFVLRVDLRCPGPPKIGTKGWVLRLSMGECCSMLVTMSCFLWSISVFSCWYKCCACMGSDPRLRHLTQRVGWLIGMYQCILAEGGNGFRGGCITIWWSGYCCRVISCYWFYTLIMLV